MGSQGQKRRAGRAARDGPFLLQLDDGAIKCHIVCQHRVSGSAADSGSLVPPPSKSCHARHRGDKPFYFSLFDSERSPRPFLPVSAQARVGLAGESIREVNFQTLSHSKIGQPQRVERGR